MKKRTARKDSNFVIYAAIHEGNVYVGLTRKGTRTVPKAVKERSDLTTFAVGLITEPAQAEAVLQRGDADLVALARAFLYNPRWGWHAAAALEGQVQASPAYWRCLPREAGAVFGPDARIGMR